MTVYSIGSKQPTVPIDGRFWVADTARLIGDVKLQENCSVWFGAVIRGDNERISLGFGCNIQENCVLHTDVGCPIEIGDNCTIGHGAILHGCTIGNNCIIGMGAIILNGGKVGHNCMVGARTLITEDKEFLADGKLILGSPAKVVRDLTKDEINAIELSALSYQSKALIFNEEMKIYT